MGEVTANHFVPVGGKLGQILFENPEEEIAIRLEFFIEIAFQSFEIDGEELKPLFRADRIVVPVKSYRQLAGETFEFPWAPKPGSVGAAMLLFREHNPADVTQIRFGEFNDGSIRAAFSTEVDFEIEADRDDLGQIEFEFDLDLSVDSLRVATGLEKRHQSDPDMIANAAAPAVALADYGTIEKIPGGFAFPVLGAD